MDNVLFQQPADNDGPILQLHLHPIIFLDYQHMAVVRRVPGSVKLNANDGDSGDIIIV